VLTKSAHSCFDCGRVGGLLKERELFENRNLAGTDTMTSLGIFGDVQIFRLERTLLRVFGRENCEKSESRKHV
jgi:hypothetical protein